MAITKEKMTRDDLRCGYLVKLRNGEFLLVARAMGFTKILVSESGSWMYLSEYADDLTKRTPGGFSMEFLQVCNDLDIVEVYGLIKGMAMYGETLHAVDTTKHRDLLWERKNPVKMTMEELCKTLGFEVEIVTSK